MHVASTLGQSFSTAVGDDPRSPLLHRPITYGLRGGPADFCASLAKYEESYKYARLPRLSARSSFVKHNR